MKIICQHQTPPCPGLTICKENDYPTARPLDSDNELPATAQTGNRKTKSPYRTVQRDALTAVLRNHKRRVKLEALAAELKKSKQATTMLLTRMKDQVDVNDRGCRLRRARKKRTLVPCCWKPLLTRDGIPKTG